MALSNIFREPRREITESVVGIAVVGGLLYGDYHLAVGLSKLGANPLPIPAGMFVGIFLILAVSAVLAITHYAGEAICDAFAKRGLELRPRNRR